MVTDNQLIKIANYRNKEVKLANQLTKIANFRKNQTTEKSAGLLGKLLAGGLRRVNRFPSEKYAPAIGIGATVGTGGSLLYGAGLKVDEEIQNQASQEKARRRQASQGGARRQDKALALEKDILDRIDATGQALQKAEDSSEFNQRENEYLGAENKRLESDLQNSADELTGSQQVTNTLAGAGIGAAGGGAIGSQIGDGWTGTGATIGGIGGGLIGNQYGGKIRDLVGSLIS